MALSRLPCFSCLKLSQKWFCLNQMASLQHSSSSLYSRSSFPAAFDESPSSSKEDSSFLGSKILRYKLSRNNNSKRNFWSRWSGRSDKELIEPEKSQDSGKSDKEVALRKGDAEPEEVSKTKKQTDFDNTKGLYQFFQKKSEWGRNSTICGREWTVAEIRLKSNEDLHKLWFVLLKERNVLITLKHACKEANEYYPNPERYDRIQLSMQHLEEVVRERNEAYLELETGKSGERPKRKITEFTGFTHEKYSDEHILPQHMNKKKRKEYEIPYLDEDAYVFQKYWKEKEYIKRRDEEDDWKRRRKLHKYIYQY